jgi:hypothetical protein
MKRRVELRPGLSTPVRPEVAHRGCHVLVPHPQLDGWNRHTSIRVPSAERTRRLWIFWNGLPLFQYSSGSRNVVADLSASVMIQMRVPSLSR